MNGSEPSDKCTYLCFLTVSLLNENLMHFQQFELCIVKSIYNNCMQCVSNDKWKFVVHGGVDGFSRIPVYLRWSGNNQACTGLQSSKRQRRRECGDIYIYAVPSPERPRKGEHDNRKDPGFLVNL